MACFQDRMVDFIHDGGSVAFHGFRINGVKEGIRHITSARFIRFIIARNIIVSKVGERYGILDCSCTFRPGGKRQGGQQNNGQRQPDHGFLQVFHGKTSTFIVYPIFRRFSRGQADGLRCAPAGRGKASGILEKSAHAAGLSMGSS
jgi:hypothetical protein